MSSMVTATVNPVYDALLRGRRLVASDVHARIKQYISYRVNRRLRTETGEQPTIEVLRAFLEAELTQEKLAKFDRLGYLDFGIDFSNRAGLERIGRVRVNARYGEGRTAISLSIRLHAGRIFRIEEFGIGGYVEKNIAVPHRGMDLIAAPMGQGKSALTKAILQTLADMFGLTIASYEDPIEQRIMPSRGVVEQIEIGSDVATYAETEAPLKRTDLDVVSYGELRDRDTKRAALAASRSMQCVTTTHAGSTIEAIDDFIESFPPNEQSEIRVGLAQTLHSVIALRALPRLATPGETPEQLERRLDGRQDIRIAAEILHVTDAVRNLIRKGETYRIRMEQLGSGRDAGSRTLEKHMVELVLAGEIDPNDPLILREIRHRDDFDSELRRARSGEAR